MDLERLKVSLRQDCNGTLYYLDLEISRRAVNNSKDIAISTTVLETSTAKKTVLVMKEMDLQTSTAQVTTAGADVWHKHLDHPNEYRMQQV